MTPEEYAQVALVGCGELPFGTLIRVSDSIRAALRERDRGWAAALKASHFGTLAALHSEDCSDSCARLRALLEEAAL